MNWLRRFMVGRYGVDHLSIFLLVVAIILSIIARFTPSRGISIIFIIITFIAYFRIISKDFSRRQHENNEYLKVYRPIKNKFKSIIQRIKDIRKYKRFKCPGCKQALRVPRGKGKLAITCPKCKTGIIKKT